MAVNPVDARMGKSRAVHASFGPPSPPHGDALARGEAMDAAVAVLAVAAELVRYAADAALRSRRTILRHLPVTAQRPVLGRGLRGSMIWAVTHPVSATVQALAAAADELVPNVTRAVLARLDVPTLIREFVDVDRLAAMLDVDAVVARADLDAVLDRVDLDSIVARVDLDLAVNQVDLDAVAARLDLDALVDKVDISRILDRIDLDAIVARVDLDGAVERVDLDRAVDRVDVDRVIARTDVAGLARYLVQVIDLPGLLRASTDSVSAEMARGVRDQGAEADRAVERVVDRLLHRPGRRTGPAT